MTEFERDPGTGNRRRPPAGEAGRGGRIQLVALAISLVAGGTAAGLAAVGPTGWAGHFPDSPPPGFSGGFGQASCHACHFLGKLNDEGGSLALAGVPDRYTSGRNYTLTVTLTRPGMALGGFQLTARFEDGGAQAGRLTLPEGQAERLTIVVSDEVQYAQQLQPGTALAAADTASWQVIWTAPPAGGRVLFHVAANAADGDGAIDGDFAYTHSTGSLPALPARGGVRR